MKVFQDGRNTMVLLDDGRIGFSRYSLEDAKTVKSLRKSIKATNDPFIKERLQTIVDELKFSSSKGVEIAKGRALKKQRTMIKPKYQYRIKYPKSGLTILRVEGPNDYRDLKFFNHPKWFSYLRTFDDGSVSFIIADWWDQEDVLNILRKELAELYD